MNPIGAGKPQKKYNKINNTEEQAEYASDNEGGNTKSDAIYEMVFNSQGTVDVEKRMLL